MEHRYSVRVTTTINAVIVRQGVPVAMGRIRDCSKTGFFIETDYDDVSLLQHLDIELQDREPGKTPKIKRHRYRTQVVRRAADGLGLEIEASRSKSANLLLRSILESARHGDSDKNSAAENPSDLNGGTKRHRA